MTGVHKAVAQDETLGVSACSICAAPVKRVPGGNGTTWVHSETGTVIGSGEAPPTHPGYVVPPTREG